jgi:3-hydroxyacyl-[acyl-carrier-protein] dehydratase
MRWLWIDRFVEFVRGQRAVALKCVALTEEQIDNYMPIYPVMPNSLIVEGMAQTGGLLVGEMSGFKNRVVLAKLSKAVFHRLATPGETLRYTAVVESVQPDGAVVATTSHVGDELQAETEMWFAFLDDRFPGKTLFEPVDLMRMLQVFRLFEVATLPDGTSIGPPDWMLEAERDWEAGLPHKAGV